jgi:DNA-binding SARP family transcriptional activator
MTNPGGGVRSPSIRLLGPLDVTVDSVPAALGGRQARAVFTLLALSAGSMIPTGRLIRDLWDGEPPGGAVNTVQVYVSRLRRALLAAGAGPGLLRGNSQGYLLQVPPEALDLHRFEQKAAAGRAALAAGDPVTARRELRCALSLWRGPALNDLVGAAAEAQRARLEGRRLGALADRLDAETALGQDAAIVPELQELVRRHPFEERFVGQLMTALYRCGRQADALAEYSAAGQRLTGDLGVQPGPGLRELHAEVLRHGNSLAPVRPPVPEPLSEQPPQIVLAPPDRAHRLLWAGSGRPAEQPAEQPAEPIEPALGESIDLRTQRSSGVPRQARGNTVAADSRP